MKFLLLLILISSICFATDIKVLEIDTNDGNVDNNGHGLHIAGILMRDVCPDVKLITCKYFDTNNTNEQIFKDELTCFNKALLINPYIINFSSGGSYYSQKEYDILKKLSDQGVIIVVAAGNYNLDLSLPENNYYPAKYKIKNLIPVGNLTKYGTKNISSNYGLNNMVWEIGTNVLSNYLNGSYIMMTGTSQSAGARTNRLLKQKCLELK